VPGAAHPSQALRQALGFKRGSVAIMGGQQAVGCNSLCCFTPKLFPERLTVEKINHYYLINLCRRCHGKRLSLLG